MHSQVHQLYYSLYSVPPEEIYLPNPHFMDKKGNKFQKKKNQNNIRILDNITYSYDIMSANITVIPLLI